MTEHSDTAGRSLPVERIGLGDHACMVFADVMARWKVLTAYTRAGLVRGEKVLVILNPGDLNDDAAVALLDGGSGRAEAAHRSGQLEFARNTSVYLPDGRFSVGRQLDTNAALIDRAYQEGYTGVRGAADMTWALQPGVDADQVVEYESSVEPLFVDPRIAAICWYDRRRFSDHLVATMRRVHPLQVMERLDALDVTLVPGGARIAGSAELSTREEFVAALRKVLGRQPVTGAFHFELDLTDLCYMEAHCAWQLIDFAAALPEGNKVTVRCGPLLDLVLQGLGAADVPQLELSVESEA